MSERGGSVSILDAIQGDEIVLTIDDAERRIPLRQEGDNPLLLGSFGGLTVAVTPCRRSVLVRNDTDSPKTFMVVNGSRYFMPTLPPRQMITEMHPARASR